MRRPKYSLVLSMKRCHLPEPLSTCQVSCCHGNCIFCFQCVASTSSAFYFSHLTVRRLCLHLPEKLARFICYDRLMEMHRHIHTPFFFPFSLWRTFKRFAIQWHRKQANEMLTRLMQWEMLCGCTQWPENDTQTTQLLLGAPDDAVVSVVLMVAAGVQIRREETEEDDREVETKELYISLFHIDFFFSSLQLHFPWPVRNVDWALSVLTCCKKGVQLPWWQSHQSITLESLNLYHPCHSLLPPWLCFLVVGGRRGGCIFLERPPTPTPNSTKLCWIINVIIFLQAPLGH